MTLLGPAKRSGIRTVQWADRLRARDHNEPNWSGYEVTTMRDMRAVFDALLVFASIIMIGTIVTTWLP